MTLGSFDKILEKLVPKKDRLKNEMVVHYLRIYTHLVMAGDMLTAGGYERSMNLLTIVRNLTKNCSFREEEPYYRNICKITSDILVQRSKIKRRIKAYNASDPAHTKTKLHLAENICILRILKISLK